MKINPETPHDDADESHSVNKQTGHTRLGVLAIFTALAAVGAYGAIKGFNTSPRAEGGVSLSDARLNTELKCVRDTFHDAVSGVSLTRNKWIAENCSSEIKARIKQALSQEDPLKALTSLRDEIFAESGEYPAGIEKWFQSYQGQSDGFAARIEVDREAQMRQYQQKAIKPATSLPHKGTTRQQRGQ